MSFSLLRVPKRAALTALQGIIVGTSCSLLLVITEDRRRRIKLAEKIIDNAERIRSCKQYHAAHTVRDQQDVSPSKLLDDFLEEPQPSTRRARTSSLNSIDWDDFLKEPEPSIKYTPKIGRRRMMTQEYKDWSKGTADSVVVETMRDEPAPGHAPGATEISRYHMARSDAAESSPPAPTLSASAPTVSPATKRSRQIWKGSVPFKLTTRYPMPALFKAPPPVNENSMPPPSEVAAPERPDIDVQANLKRMREALAMDLEMAATIFVETIQAPNLTDEDKAMLRQEGAPLCVKCQEAEFMDSAALVLGSVVCLGATSEDDYFAFNPQPVIERAIAAAEAAIAQLKSKPKLHNPQRTLARNSLNRVLRLLLFKPPDWTISATRLQEWLRLAEKTMDLAFELEYTAEQGHIIWWRIVFALKADPDGRVTRQYFQRLGEQQRHKRILNSFHMSRTFFEHFTPSNWYSIGDIAAEAAVAAGVDPSKLLKTMIDFCPTESCSPDQPLRTTWATQLLYAHWQQRKDFDGTLTLFRDLFEVGEALTKVVFMDGPYRTMMQIAIEAERWADADALLVQLGVVKPSAVKEARVQGLLSQGKAKMGDWNGVWENFKKIEIKDRIDYAFGPILFEFACTHTAQETGEFVKLYIEEIGIPINSHVVTMVANKYGHLRDVQAFLDWLEYCTDKGFQVDAAFGNAIIQNCRRRWDFNGEDLKRVYLTLKALSPNFVDEWTEADMITNVLRTHRHQKTKYVKRDAALMGARYRRLTSIVDPHELRADMRHAVVLRKHQRVVLLYEAAYRRRTTMDSGHLQMAIRATLKLDTGIKNAVRIAKEGKDRGIDISPTLVPIFMTQLPRILNNYGSDSEKLEYELQRLVGIFDHNNLNLDARAVLRAGHVLLQAKCYDGAIKFALSALHRKGVAYPDDIPTFQLFMIAYAWLANHRGMKWTLVGAVHLQYYHKKRVYQTLKYADSILSHQIQSPDVLEARRIVRDGINMVRDRRETLVKERQHLEKGALEIMKRAALEADMQSDSEEVIRARNEILREMEEKAAREEALQAEWRAEQEARAEAARAAEEQNKAQADLMEMLIEAHKYDSGAGGF